MENIRTDFYSGRENFKRIRDYITFELINYKLNAAMLLNAVFEPVLDLAKVYIIMTFDREDLPAVTLIEKDMFESWGISRDELRVIAQKNADRLMEPRIHILKGTFKRNADIDIYICSNPRQFLGASVMVYKSRPIQTWAVNKHMNVLIIPSSIHELLLVEAKDFIGIEKLRDVMKEFNESTNKRSEVLSSNIYRYMTKNNDIEMMTSFNSMFRDYYV